MKLVNILIVLLLAAMVIGFVWFATMDISPDEATITEQIPGERFIKDE